MHLDAERSRARDGPLHVRPSRRVPPDGRVRGVPSRGVHGDEQPQQQCFGVSSVSFVGVFRYSYLGVDGLDADALGRLLDQRRGAAPLRLLVDDSAPRLWKPRRRRQRPLQQDAMAPAEEMPMVEEAVPPERGRAQHLVEERLRAVVAVRVALTYRTVDAVAK